MNLNKMLKASCQDLEWLASGKTFQPKDKDTNIKDDLEIEWGYGAINPIYNPRPDFSETASKSEDSEANAVVRTAKILLMQGIMGKDFIVAMRKRFGDTVIARHKRKVGAVLKQEGLLGCIAIDPHGFKNCVDAAKIAKKSPYRRHIKFVVACNKCAGCDCFKKEIVAVKNGSEFKATKSSVDDFFQSNTSKIRVRAYCKKLGCTIIVSRDDLDESEMDPTFIDLVNGNQLTEEEAKLVRSKGDALTQAKKAFRLIDKKRRLANVKHYADEPESQRVSISESPMDFDIAKEVVAGSAELDVLNSNVEVDSDSIKSSLYIDGSTFIEPEFEGIDELTVDVGETFKPLDVDPRSDLTL